IVNAGGAPGLAGNSGSGGAVVSISGGGEGGGLSPGGGTPSAGTSSAGTSTGGSEQPIGGMGGSAGQLNGGASSGGAPAIPTCGDGTCNGSETQSTCCQDCGCQGGYTCASNTCQANPHCGDGTCNGSETQSTCCQDCGCQGGYTCTSNTCQANPRCGDGTCNGSETQSSCCQDCGCATNYSCNSNACTCSSSTPRWVNNMPNNAGYCVNLQQSYTQTSVAYVSVNNGSGYALKYGEHLDGSSGAVGTSYALKVQCCYWDGCVGGQGTTVNGVISGYCSYNGNSVPCICTAQHSYTVNTTECGIDAGNVCGTGGFN
ncbi:MAG TPA: hypothetical protein VNG33_14315, partial [Polyangiaceae bacterium]|nr:hypothetical protein [Polyangiaceae bacterium]